MINGLSNFNTINIPDIWQLILSFIIAVLLVYLVEWLKQPSAEISLLPDLVLKDGRKFLKVKVKIYKKGFLKRVFPWQNPVSYARLKGYLLGDCDNNKVNLFSYVAKWDTRPEPWDYITNKPKIELLPASSEPENLLVGDECPTSIAVKHPGEQHFYVYDANYYVNPLVNQRDEKMVKLRLVFSSSSVTTKKDFIIINGNKTTDSFQLKGIDNNEK